MRRARGFDNVECLEVQPMFLTTAKALRMHRTTFANVRGLFEGAVGFGSWKDQVDGLLSYSVAFSRRGPSPYVARVESLPLPDSLNKTILAS
jgi:hypothetical protein